MSTVTTTKLSDADVAAIHQICDLWDEVLPTRDWDRAATTLSEDFVFYFPEQPPMNGRSAWRQWVESFPPIQHSKINLEEIDGRDDLAFIRATQSVTIEADGKPVTNTSRWICILRKQPDGSWLLASESTNFENAMSLF